MSSSRFQIRAEITQSAKKIPVQTEPVPQFCSPGLCIYCPSLAHDDMCVCACMTVYAVGVAPLVLMIVFQWNTALWIL